MAIVGDLTNVAGDEDLEEALREGDYDDVASEASDQEDEGADIVGVSAALPGVDEAGALCGLVEELEGMVSLPLWINAHDPAALEAGLRGYAGKPLVGPVDGTAGRLEATLPLVRKYGCGMVVAMPDEGGTPATAEERVRVAERVIAAAEQAGVPRCDIVVDCSALLGAGDSAEAEVVRALSLCRLLGVRTMLSVPAEGSGVFPNADDASAFLAAALDAGLDLPVFDARSERYREVVEASE